MQRDEQAFLEYSPASSELTVSIATILLDQHNFHTKDLAEKSSRVAYGNHSSTTVHGSSSSGHFLRCGSFYPPYCQPILCTVSFTLAIGHAAL